MARVLDAASDGAGRESFRAACELRWAWRSSPTAREAGCSRGSSAHAREAGSGTVLILAVLAALIALVVGGAAVVSARLAATRSAVAADLAALAAAQGFMASGGPACGEGGRVAFANGADLVTCSDRGDLSVEVTVAVPLRVRLPGLPSNALSTARAGPRYVEER